MSVADSSHSTVYSIATTLFAIFVLYRVFCYWRALGDVDNIPGYRVLFKPLAFPGALIPTSWWNPGLEFTWSWRQHLYGNSENFSVIPLLMDTPVIYTSNLDVARQVLAGGTRSNFIKPMSMSRALALWGMNLIISEGAIWRKHRRVLGPAFNNAAYEMVWDATSRIYYEMVAHEGWLTAKNAEVAAFQDLSMQITLLVLASAGFGIPLSWSEATENGSMSLQQAIRIVSDDNALAILVPKWAWNLPISRLNRLRDASAVLETFMRSHIAKRKADLQKGLLDGSIPYADERKDVLSMLVQANEADGNLKLDDSELLGNVFGMLVAGHESTAVTLVATLAFLAIDQDLQEEVLQQIIDVVGQDREPAFEDYPKLKKVLAVFYEALRHFPAAYVSIREATEDAVLVFPNPIGQTGSTSRSIRKGTQVVVDWVGVEYNPRYFEDPYDFKPSRWYHHSSEELVTAFSVGPRACPGRRFAVTEAVCLLSLLLRDWRIEPLLLNGEDLGAWRQRVINAEMRLTMHIRPASLRLVARNP